MMQLSEYPVCTSASRRRERADDECKPMEEIERPRKRVRFASLAETHIVSYTSSDVADPFACNDNENNTPSGAEENPIQLDLEHPKEATSSEVKREYRSWLTKRELAYFRACAKKMCKSVDLDNALHHAYDHEDDWETDYTRTLALLEHDDYSKQRGLERWSSSQHSFARSTKIIEVKTAVLLEQSSQMLSGRMDSERLATVARAASEKSQRFAHVLALADATMAVQVQEGCRAA